MSEHELVRKVAEAIEGASSDVPPLGAPVWKWWVAEATAAIAIVRAHDAEVTA